ncbi:MAG: STAS domain-containing protein [Actinobacteria bacterium]|nr:STAS domain-containing protein [Actinomycetota bacterium]
MHTITVENSPRANVVTASGELDAYVALDLAAALAEADSGSRRLIANLESVSFMDSTALGLLVRTVRDRDERGHETRIVLPRGAARRIFEITALDEALPISPSLGEAME